MQTSHIIHYIAPFMIRTLELVYLAKYLTPLLVIQTDLGVETLEDFSCLR
jgi:hypothetical protein